MAGAQYKNMPFHKEKHLLIDMIDHLCLFNIYVK